MGWLSDNFDFEKFHLSDMWDRIKDDPKRLILGVDPASTELWNTILNRDDEAIMNQLGGPMGSGWAGLGETGGVYGRAEEAGIDTGAAGGMHDIAETVAMIWGGGAAAQGLGNIGGAAEVGGAAAGGGGGAAGTAGGSGSGAFVGPPEAAGGGGGGGFWSDWSIPFGGEGGGFGNMDWSDPNSYMSMMQGMGGMGGGQPQRQTGPQFGGMPMTQSSFEPQYPQMPEPFMPSRPNPFGLLMEDDEEARMKAMMGGLL